MNGAKAEDILHSFKEGMLPLKFQNLLQVSMDGPNVNWKFFRLLSEENNCKKILEMGSCGLHVLYGAFQTGHKAAGWKIADFLKSIYW